MTKDIEARMDRAKQAETFLGNPLVKDLVLTNKERFFTLWANTEPDEADKREAIYAEYRGLLRLINEIRQYVQDGKIIAQRVQDGSRKQD